MSRSLTKRVRRLEAEHLGAPCEAVRDRKQRSHMIFGADDAEAERQLAALKLSGTYQDGDPVVRLRWMTESQAKARGWA